MRWENIGSLWLVTMSPSTLASAFTGLFLLPLLGAEHPRLDFALGVLEQSRGNASLAAEKFEAARQADPLALPLVERAVSARMAANDRPAAVKLYRDLAAAKPEELSIQLVYVDFLDHQGNGDVLARSLAAETLQAAQVRFPAHPEIVRRMFQHAQAAGDKPRQLELLEQLRRDDPASTLLYIALSKSLFDAEDAAARAALDDRFLETFEANPTRADLARATSDHFQNTGRVDRAIEILEQHVAVAPSSLDLRTRIGILLFSAKRDAEGEATLKEVLTINPNQALAHQTLAKFYRLREQPENARHHASELLKLRGGAAADFLKLANEWLAADHPKEARILLERALFDHPAHRELAEQLAISTRRDPETRAQAARLFREVDAAKPATAKSRPEFLVEFAHALIDQGDTRSAEEHLRTAIRNFPATAPKETAAALRQLAGIWEKENRNMDAARSLRQRADALDR
jgi:Flp pilus assembly protein TadD